MIDGVRYIEKFVADPADLLNSLIETVNWDERMASRKTASFGIAYNYSGMTYPEIAMPESLRQICEKIQSELGFTPNNSLLNYYLDGSSSMGFHADQTENLLAGTGIVIVSLGAERNLTFREIENKEHKIGYPLPSGSLIYMPQEVQHFWQHAILRTAAVGPRVSLTFRYMASNQPSA